MNVIKLNEILKKHEKWLIDEANGKRANLEQANLEGVNLKGANLEEANLKGANLEWANLEWANLKGVNLERANLEEANLDFSAFPLWCGTFNIKDNGRLTKQLLGHIARLNITDKKLAKWVKKIPKKYSNNICERHSITKV